MVEDGGMRGRKRGINKRIKGSQKQRRGNDLKFSFVRWTDDEGRVMEKNDGEVGRKRKE